jgi:hypothetical protein
MWNGTPSYNFLEYEMNILCVFLLFSYSAPRHDDPTLHIIGGSRRQLNPRRTNHDQRKTTLEDFTVLFVNMRV